MVEMLRGSNLWKVLERQQTGAATPARTHEALQSNVGLAKRLNLDKELDEHTGCVNRISWNERGTLLASVSDDGCCCVWNYCPSELSYSFETGHSRNIFGVRFLPETGDRQIVTGAMDCEVRLHTLSEAGDHHCTLYSCHSNRVKDVEVERGNPHLFWSAGEDGKVCQFDTREPPGAGAPATLGSNVLIDLRKDPSAGRWGEVKSVSLCPQRPHLLAAACGDPVVRVWDRRMADVGQGRHVEAVHQFSMREEDVGSSLWRYRRDESVHTTFVQFSKGRYGTLLANYHGDCAYTFDLAPPMTSPTPKHPDGAAAAGAAAGDGFDASGGCVGRRPASYLDSGNAPGPRRILTRDRAEARASAARLAERAGNEAYLGKRYSEAIRRMTYCVEMLEQAGLGAGKDALRVRSNRAAALHARGWCGDAMSAVWDCDFYMANTDKNAKPMAAKRISCLKKGGCYREAKKSCLQFQSKYGTGTEDDHGVGEMLERLNKVLGMRRVLSESSQSSDDDDGEHYHHDREEESEDGSSEEEEEGDDADVDGVVDERHEMQQEQAEEAAVLCDAEAAAEAHGEESGEEDGGGAAQCGGEMQEEEAPASPRAESMGLEEDRASAGEGRGASQEREEGGSGSGRRVRKRKLKRADSDPGPTPPVEEESKVVKRFVQRYVGHNNVQTDIKEAVFMGPNDEYVVAGSDDGRAFIYDRRTGELLRVLNADEAIVNCVQPHPYDFVLATSGIDNTVKLWSPNARAPKPHSVGTWGLGLSEHQVVGESSGEMEEMEESDESGSDSHTDEDEDLDKVMSRNQGRWDRGRTLDFLLFGNSHRLNM